MPTHWTYIDCESSSDLQQGDILAPTPALRAIFDEVHPHFCDDKYLAFIVITQSCDLVRRNGPCSARYINVSVVRSLSQVLPSIIETAAPALAERIYSDEDKFRTKSLLERIFNQNEQKLGLFYLYPDGDIGIGEGAVAYLRVSVALRVDHYELMLKARTGRLRDNFANKLGWLVGNLYSRVGTPDWSKSDLKRLVDEYIGAENDLDILWVSSLVAREAAGQPEPLTREAILEKARTATRRPVDVAIDRIVETVSSEIPDLPPDTLDNIRNTLASDARLSTLFKK